MEEDFPDLLGAYTALGVLPGASKEDVKAAFRHLAKSSHPDLVPDDAGAARRFALLRAAHDRIMRSSAVETASLRGRGQDILADIVVPLEFAQSGGTATIPVPAANRCRVCGGRGSSDSARRECRDCRGSGNGEISKGIIRVRIDCPACAGLGTTPGPKCGACDGSGRDPQGEPVTIRIPAGYAEGGVIVLIGKGAAGAAGGLPGDMLVTVRSAPHRRIRRSGADLLVVCWVSFADLCLGTKVEVPLLGGGRFEIPVAAGTQAGHVIRLAEKGLPAAQGVNGDLLVKIQPQVPRSLTPEHLLALRAWRSAEKGA